MTIRFIPVPKMATFLERFTNIETTNNITSGVFLTKDVAEANMLRRAILSEIDTYAIDIVIFQTNTSPRHDEVIALRLGQAIIDHTQFNPPEPDGFRTHIDVQGPGEFTTDDIPNIPFKYVTPIVTLKQGQHIVCDVIVKQGQGKVHVKWRPVSTVTLIEVDNGYKITIKDIGMLPGPEILELGFNKIPQAINRPPITLFSHPLIPNNI